MSRKNKGKQAAPKEPPPIPEAEAVPELVELPAVDPGAIASALGFAGAIVDRGAFLDDMAGTTGLERRFCEDFLVSAIVGQAYSANEDPESPEAIHAAALFEAWQSRQPPAASE